MNGDIDGFKKDRNKISYITRPVYSLAGKGAENIW